MKKIVALMLCSVLCTVAFIGCSKKNQGNTDPVVVDVRLYKAGYGTEWFYSAKEKFEELYKDKGYTINVVDESTGVKEKFEGEIAKKKTNTIDLYIIGEPNFPDVLKRSKSALNKSEDEVLLENLNDVYSSRAIKFDGTEESVTIESKLNESTKRFMKFNGTTSSKYSYLNQFSGNYYAFPWASGVSGLFINKSVFDSFDLELPRTTDELIAAYDVMCPKTNGKPSPAREGVYPMTYAGNNGAGFWLFVYDTLFAQYSGAEAEKNFWLCQPAEGTVKDNGWEVYKDEGILEALKVVEKLCDDDYCENGTSGNTEIKAQLQILQGKAAIMPTGNWAYQQMKLNYPDVVGNGVMMKMPVISALGTKLGISDATLSAIIKGVDEGKTDAAIAAECSTTETIAARVREARNIYFDYSVNHIALIPSYSPSKDVAKLFLRFLASDDNLDLYKSKAYSSLPFKYVGESKVSDNEFIRSVDEIMGYGANVAVYEDICTSPIRQNNFACFPLGGYAEVFTSLSKKEPVGDKEIYNAQYVYEKDIELAKGDWETQVTAAGMNN